MLELLRETGRSLRAHALRFTLTALGVAWGAFMLTYLSASMEGVQEHFARELGEIGPKLVYMGGGSVRKSRVGSRGSRAIELESDDVAHVAGLHSVEAATGLLSLYSTIVRAGGRTRLLKVEGVDASAREIRNLGTQRGRFLSVLDVQRGARHAVIGPGAARRLFGHEDVVGRSLQIESLRFRIVGVSIAKGDQLMDTGDPDDLKLWIPITTAQRWFARDAEVVQEILFAPRIAERSREAVRHSRQVTALHHDFHPDDGTALWFFDVHEAMASIHAALAAFRIFVLAAGIITLLVGAVGVMNIMLVVVGERRREIGLRKAVGAPARAIFVQFLAEAAAVSILAASLGSLLGMSLAKAIATIAPEGTPLQSVPLYDPITSGAIGISLVAVGIIAGVAPAVRAARTAPADALRSG